MAVEEMFTQLPTVGSAQLTDIICAVQGYVSPSNLGLSVQESLQQVYSLFQSNIILFNAGNPNGVVAGTTYQFCWDTLSQALYICTTSGTSSTAVWTKITNANSGFTWSGPATTPTAMLPNHGYININVGLGTFTLPSVSIPGDMIYLMGQGAGGWTITYGTGQTIRIGSSLSTVTTGSISSTNQYDAIQIVCVSANRDWQVPVAPQGNITVV